MQSNPITGTVKSSDGIHRLWVTQWIPEEKPVAVIQILHGMREHMGRYADFARFCLSQGYAVVGHDHLGHGKTAAAADDFGYFGERDGCHYLLADCKRVSRLIHKQWPDVPLVLMGHSMGSFLGRLHILHPPVPLAGFICMGTGGEIRAAAPARALLEAVARITGDRHTLSATNQLVISPRLVRFSDGTGENMAWLSRDPKVGEAFTADILSQPVFTNRALCDLVSLQLAATSRQWASRVDPALPILLLSGDKDVVGRNGKGVVDTYERLRAAGCRDVECKLYENARHELLNELNKEEVYYDIRQWIAHHIV